MSSVPPTDWNTYYSNPFILSKFTRRITASLALSLLRKHCRGQCISVAEPGGGNSFFYERFRREFSSCTCTVFEQNEEGIRLFMKKDVPGSRAVPGDFLKLKEDSSFDLTVSFGFIEHFTPAKTAEAVEKHFAITRPGGLVLMTFPMNLFPYPLIRGCAEKLGMWRFPDERPLSFEEVLTTAQKYGNLLEKRINRRILLTQGIVLFRKKEYS